MAFYNRGGDFTGPNKDNRIRPLGLNNQQQTNLIAFLSRPLTDPRVAEESAPFDRPQLYTETDRVPEISGSGVAGSGGLVPLALLLEPPLLGNPSFTVALQNSRVNASATWVMDNFDPGTDGLPSTGLVLATEQTLNGAGPGYASMTFAFPSDSNLAGAEIYGRFYVADPNAPNGIAISQLVTIKPFAEARTSWCASDLDGDGVGSILDMVAAINSYGEYVVPCSADMNADGSVNLTDVQQLARDWYCSSL